MRPQDVLVPPSGVAGGASAGGAAAAADTPLKGKPHEGLSSQQAEAFHREHGYNEVKTKQVRWGTSMQHAS